MTTTSQGKKKIARKILATNNKVLVRKVVCAFLKKYERCYNQNPKVTHE